MSQVSPWDVQQASRWADKVFIAGDKINRMLVNGLAGTAAQFAMDAICAARMAESHGYPPQTRRAMNRVAGICESIADTFELMADDGSAAAWRKLATDYQAKADRAAKADGLA